MRQSNIRLIKPEEFGFFEEIETRGKKFFNVLKKALSVLGAVLTIFGAVLVIGSIGAAENGAIDLRFMIWQSWTGLMLVFAGVAVLWSGKR